jgi:SAM-dependent methyltransferase
MAINRLLTDKDREELKPLIDDMFSKLPEMMKRKINLANVQQAFVLDTVKKWITYGCRILSVGCFEDTAYEYLMNTPNKAKAEIVGIDPQINFDLHSYKGMSGLFDIVFSTSVLEHVKDDEEFVADICNLLKVGGAGILTMDFNNDYRVGDKLPYTDLRFYTKHDLEFRLTKILTDNGCDLVDVPDWSGTAEFTHDGCNYSFSTFVFRKK